MRFIILSVLLLLTGILNALTHTGETIPAPNFKTNTFIINPDNLSCLDNKDRFYPLKETYFYKRLIEPIIIAVESIDNNTEQLLEDYVRLNDLEAKTNGRFFIQLYVQDQSKVDFHIGSQLKPIYKQSFLDDLNTKYGAKTKHDKYGQYQYVIFQKLGSYLIDKVAFYYDLATTENYVLPSYPTELILASREYETARYYQKAVIKREETNKLLGNSNNIWVSNPNQIITEAEANTIDQKLKEIESKTGYETAVVILNSINNEDAYDFGLRLFNSWGIGKKNKNNGLLIEVVLNPRALTFITGAGTELVLSDAATYTIGQDYVKPSFRSGNYAEGILKGLDKIQSIFEGNDVPEITNSNFNDTSNYPWYERYPLLAIYFGFAGVLLFIYLIVLLINIMFVKDLHRRYHILKFFNLLIFPFTFPIPFAALYFFNRFLMNRWRNTVRFGELKGEIMHKLEESEEDEYLSQGQITEERIKSIDYDVWVTSSHSEILVLGYKDWINKYKRCPKCAHKTYFKAYDKTVRAATYSRSGSGERKYYCENCKHEKITNYTIPKLVKSKSNYSRGGSSWGGGSSWSGGGGSSWGGGFSGGGGSSSGW